MTETYGDYRLFKSIPPSSTNEQPGRARLPRIYVHCAIVVRRVTFSNARVNEDWRKLATCTKEVY